MNFPTDVLIIGGGGREHALGWKLKQSPKVGNIFFAPGNGGTCQIGENVPIPVTDLEHLLRFAKMHEIGLTIVGPEEPLNLGIVDLFQESGLRIFGPTKAAARIEASKSEAKTLMKRYGIPTAKYQSFSDYNEASQYVRLHGVVPCVVKASGPASGKGAIICQTVEEALSALVDLMVTRIFDRSGETVVIEDRLFGPELSSHAFCDRFNFRPVPFFVQDHKRQKNGDQGENTGGMGTFGPVPVAPTLAALVSHLIIGPTIEAMKQGSNGTIYRGALFPGLMITDDGPKVLEFNARMGDPETQVLMRLLDSDPLDLFLDSVNDNLHHTKIKWKDGYAACIVMASGGYPGAYEKGFPIHGLKDALSQPGDISIFHAGTTMRDGRLVTNGGRVLSVTAYAKTPEQVLNNVYRAVGRIHFEGEQFRSDIGESVLRIR